MTNGWIDIKNTDMMLIMGGNPAENHPCGFKWAIEAKIHRNAKTIVVDPRLTRTAATADMYVQIRAGADIAFLGGLINYAIQNNRIAHDYLVNYTNAAFIVKEGFKLPEDGLFAGFDAATLAIRISAPEAAVLPLHARDGGADHRHSTRSVPQGCRSLHVDPQGRRHEEGRQKYLPRARDTAHLRYTEYTLRRQG